MVVVVFLSLSTLSSLPRTHCWELWNKKVLCFGGWGGGLSYKSSMKISFFSASICNCPPKLSIGCWNTLDWQLGFVPWWKTEVTSKKKVPLTVIISDCPLNCKWSFIGCSAIISISLQKHRKGKASVWKCWGRRTKPHGQCLPCCPNLGADFLTPAVASFWTLCNTWTVWVPHWSGWQELAR